MPSRERRDTDHAARLRLGTRFHKVMEATGWTAKRLAAELHITPPTLSKWFRGETSIPAEKLKQAADLMKVAVTEIIGNGETPLPMRSKSRRLMARFNCYGEEHQDSLMRVCEAHMDAIDANIMRRRSAANNVTRRARQA